MTSPSDQKERTGGHAGLFDVTPYLESGSVCAIEGSWRMRARPARVPTLNAAQGPLSEVREELRRRTQVARGMAFDEPCIQRCKSRARFGPATEAVQKSSPRHGRA